MLSTFRLVCNQDFNKKKLVIAKIMQILLVYNELAIETGKSLILDLKGLGHYVKMRTKEKEQKFFPLEGNSKKTIEPVFERVEVNFIKVSKLKIKGS